MPAFNSEDVLAFAIESVLAQSESNLELVVVDDASTDGTRAVAESYVRLDARVRLVCNSRNSRAGPIEWEARNDGLKIARGWLIAYLDADNTWRPDFVEQLSRVLLAEDQLQIAHCDSCNHYSEEQAVYARATDGRRLINYGPTWTIFSYDVLDPARLGYDQYVDTNEMMHRASVFERLGALWRTHHPDREGISRRQPSLRPSRRHNDLELFERIITAFGFESCLHLKLPLVDYYYPSAARARRTRVPDEPIHPQTRAGLSQLNIDRFYGSYLEPTQGGYKLDLGLGEVDVPGLDPVELYAEFACQGGMGDRLVHYNGARTLRGAYRELVRHYQHSLGAGWLTEHNLALFDGCHEAIGSAIDIFTGCVGNPAGRDAVAFAVPSYPYWAIAAASHHRTVVIEAPRASVFIAGLKRLDQGEVGAVIVNWPSNPLGYEYSTEDVAELNRLARERRWGLVVDITYHAFLESGSHAILDLAPERTILCDSVSKAWGVPGLRLGFAACADEHIAGALRAYKSGRSLLPSSLKLAFFAHMLLSQPDTPQLIVSTVHERRQRLRRALMKAAPELGIRLTDERTPGLYEILYLDHHPRDSPAELAALLLAEDQMIVTADGAFYPPYHRPTSVPPFVRLSLGRCEDVELAAALLRRHTSCAVSVI
jgi:aspartate/methionine/tyrosine aminotransferase/glycosyltransferase involved in cell wall biosynthesis